MTQTAKLEMHTHTFIRGPRSNGMFIRERQQTTSTFTHSHAGGHLTHEHPDTGPSAYTIDKDDWARATGLKGGGRKKYTATSTGEQLPYVERDPASTRFSLVIVGDPTPEYGTGPGFAPAARMILGHGLTCVFTDARPKKPGGR